MLPSGEAVLCVCKRRQVATRTSRDYHHHPVSPVTCRSAGQPAASAQGSSSSCGRGCIWRGGSGRAAGEGPRWGGGVGWVLGDSWRREHSALPKGGWGAGMIAPLLLRGQFLSCACGFAGGCSESFKPPNYVHAFPLRPSVPLSLWGAGCSDL